MTNFGPKMLGFFVSLNLKYLDKKAIVRLAKYDGLRAIRY